MITAKNETRSARLSRKGTGGFTIVELIVAAVIILIAVFGVVSAVRKSTEMQVNDYHRRQARAYIMNLFETTFGYGQYFDGAGAYNPVIEGIVHPITVGSGITINDITIIEQIGDNPPLDGNMSISVQPEVKIVDPNTSVNVHVITITLRWSEVGGVGDSLKLTKRLADSS